jgi:hypothetical protein
MLTKFPVELFARYILYDEAPVTALQLTIIPDEDCAVTLSPVGVAKEAVVPLLGDENPLQPASLPPLTVK